MYHGNRRWFAGNPSKRPSQERFFLWWEQECQDPSWTPHLDAFEQLRFPAWCNLRKEPTDVCSAHSCCHSPQKTKWWGQKHTAVQDTLHLPWMQGAGSPPCPCFTPREIEEGHSDRAQHLWAASRLCALLVQLAQVLVQRDTQQGVNSISDHTQL